MLVTGAVVVATPALGASSDPQQLSLSPSSSQVAAPVTATASGFGRCLASPLSATASPGTVRFLWDGKELARSTVDFADGTASTTFVVPEPSTAGAHRVDAECLASPKLLASTEFTVTPPPTPTPSLRPTPTAPPTPKMPATTVVPDLFGETQSTAVAMLHARHLKLGRTWGKFDRANFQNPVAGTEVEPGTSVVVGFGRPAPKPPDGSAPWGTLAAGAAVLLALFLGGLTGYRAHLRRSSRRWIRGHVQVLPAPEQGRTKTITESLDDDGAHTTVVALQTRMEAGRRAVEEMKR